MGGLCHALHIHFWIKETYIIGNGSREEFIVLHHYANMLPPVLNADVGQSFAVN